MSNHLAIATVTATLGRLALSAADSVVNGVPALSFGRPVPPANAEESLKLHVYLYQVTPNAALRNNDLPTRDGNRKLTSRPRAALDLHYLISFYGDDKTFEADRMLGAVVRDLHANPIPGRDFISNVIASFTSLDGSDLAAAPESIRFSQTHLSLEDLSRLWSIMVQSPYAVSVPYVATVVVIDALEGGPTALPVLKRGEDDRGVETSVGPFPRLDSYWAGTDAGSKRRPRVPSYPAAQLGARLVVSGANLGGDVVTLRFTHSRFPAPRDIVVAQADREKGELRLTLPDDAAAQDLWATGVYSAAVITEQGGSTRTSGILPIVLAPRITSIQPNPAAGAGGDVALTVTIHPKIQPKQIATLLIGDREVLSGAHAAVTDKLSFTVPAAPALTNASIRLRVDGVDSFPVKYDDVTGAFVFDDTQRVTIT